MSQFLFPDIQIYFISEKNVDFIAQKPHDQFKTDPTQQKLRSPVLSNSFTSPMECFVLCAKKSNPEIPCGQPYQQSVSPFLCERRYADESEYLHYASSRFLWTLTVCSDGEVRRDFGQAGECAVCRQIAVDVQFGSVQTSTRRLDC